MALEIKKAKKSITIKGTHRWGFFHLFASRMARKWLRSWDSGPLDWPGERYWVLGPFELYHYPRPIPQQ